MTIPVIPSATYRLQFNAEFTFEQATKLVPYFSALGVSHLYASPLFKARKGSKYGYDVVDYSKLNPEIGSEEDFFRLVEALKEHHMGLIVDIVPNHMAVGSENKWWMDILEKGVSSKYASFFDINWNPFKPLFTNKIFLPILEQPFGITLESKLLQLTYEKGRFVLNYGETSLPISLQSHLNLISSLHSDVGQLYFSDHVKIRALNSIIEMINDEDVNDEAQRKNIYNSIEGYFKEYPDILDLLIKQLDVLNGIKGHPSSFNELEKFLENQNYRLCYWKVANDEVNYRRFFDICEYASMRIEEPEVFRKINEKTFEYLKNGYINGLRIDHVDGLWDPQEYLENLHHFSPNISYLVVEKILTGNEQLRPEWPVQGTVGYDFMNQLNGVFVYQGHKQQFLEIYQSYSGLKGKLPDLKYECKKLLLSTSLASELNFLTVKLNHLSSNYRLSKDFTWENLKKGLTEIISCFPVYRSYIRAPIGEVHEADRKYIHAAVERARRYNTSVDSAIYNFIENVLLLDISEGIAGELKKQFNYFVMHFQQITGPVMAKGLEDTAFYRYFPLSSLNEVGGEIGSFGLSIENFHKKNLERYTNHPNSMLSSSTHDTKRSEDVRARINVLSEIPEKWEKALDEWGEWNKKHKIQHEETLIPDNNEEYLIYQTLIGIWPLKEEEKYEFISRIQNFIDKAIKEAKVHSSWIQTNEPYHNAVKQFIAKILDESQSKKFLVSFKKFFNEIKESCFLNSLSQLVLKFTSPGVPDIYQGNELFTYCLVDPDNRQPIDYSIRKELIQKIPEKYSWDEVKNKSQFDLFKLFMTQKLLYLRRENKKLFLEGSYLPLPLEGDLSNHLIAFARYFGNQVVIVVTSRFFTLPSSNDNNLILPMELSQRGFRDIFTNQQYTFVDTKIPLNKVLTSFPFTVLISS